MITVNNIEITEANIGEEMQYHPAENKRAVQVKAAESLIIGELFKQRAQTLGIAPSKPIVSVTDEDQTLDLLIEKEVDIPLATDDECERYFAANTGKFHSTTILEVRHILLAAAPDDSDDRDKMSELSKVLLKQLQQNPDSFADMVKKYSSCPSKEQGGNLGQISKGQTVPEFEKALLNADQGIVTFPIESRYGFHLAVIDRKVAGKALPFEAVADKIKQFLNEKVRRKAIAQYIETLIGDAKIEGFTFDVADDPLMQ